MFALLFALLLASNSPAHAKLKSDCGDVAGTHPYKYCITIDTESRNQDVLYVLPGAGGDGHANWYTEDPAFDGMKKTWRDLHYQAPRVIEVSFGPIWLLVPQNESRHSGLFEYFLENVMPTMEGKLSGKLGARRIVGHSMGGLNGAILTLLRPELFRSAALLAPAFIGVSPFATAEETNAYASERKIPKESMDNLIQIAGAVVSTPAEWDAFSPSVIAARYLNAKSPALYVSAGTKDVRFYEEARRFADVAEKAGAPVIWDGHDGDHGYVKFDVVARFLTL